MKMYKQTMMQVTRLSGAGQVREHIPVPYDNLFKSILSFSSRCQSYFKSRSHMKGDYRQN